MRLSGLRAGVFLIGTTVLAGGCAGRMVNQCVRPFSGGPPPRSDSTVTVLSYNIKGLPGWLGGNNDRRYEAIASTLDSYDVVAIQELFHRRMRFVDELPSGFAASLAERGRLMRARVYGSGLALTAREEVMIPALRKAHVFQDCAGRFGGGSDCWSRKGVLVGGMRLPNGDTLHVYSLHLDANGRANDRAVRARQLAEVTQLIDHRSHDKPVLVMGDFNIDLKDSTEHATLARFAERLGLQDARALERASCTKYLDYVFYRGTTRTPLRLTASGVDGRAFGDPPSSDHPPIYAVFAY